VFEVAVIAVLVGLAVTVGATAAVRGTSPWRLFRADIQATPGMHAIALRRRLMAVSCDETGGVLLVPLVDQPRRRWHVVLSVPSVTPRRTMVIGRRGELRSDIADGVAEIELGIEELDTKYALNGRPEPLGALFSITPAREAVDAALAFKAVRAIAFKAPGIILDVEMNVLNAREARERLRDLAPIATTLARIAASLPEGAIVSGSSASGDPVPIPLFRR
jgi:hypothetical protein